MRFVGKFQQVTSPVTAKGIEDTALYIYNRLVSLNEVGGEPDRFGVAPEALHAWLAERAAALAARRCRPRRRTTPSAARTCARGINVLSEMPGAWKQATARWARANRRGRSIVDGQSYPSRNEEYLLYQTLIGTWPLEPMTAEQEADYRDRIVAYMHKAMREAKVYTSWLNPSERARAGDDALRRDGAGAGQRRRSATTSSQFQRRVAQLRHLQFAGAAGVKIGAPGVPDFYQGTELWDFSLVDPDNRRPVDYERRRTLLAELDDARATSAAGRRRRASSLRTPRDDRLKLYTTHDAAALPARASGPLPARRLPAARRSSGTRRDHVFAFARTHGRAVGRSSSCRG